MRVAVILFLLVGCASTPKLAEPDLNPAHATAPTVIDSFSTAQPAVVIAPSVERKLVYLQFPCEVDKTSLTIEGSSNMLDWEPVPFHRNGDSYDYYVDDSVTNLKFFRARALSK